MWSRIKKAKREYTLNREVYSGYMLRVQCIEWIAIFGSTFPSTNWNYKVHAAGSVVANSSFNTTPWFKWQTRLQIRDGEQKNTLIMPYNLSNSLSICAYVLACVSVYYTQDNATLQIRRRQFFRFISFHLNVLFEVGCCFLFAFFLYLGSYYRHMCSYEKDSWLENARIHQQQQHQNRQQLARLNTGRNNILQLLFVCLSVRVFFFE